MRQTWSTADGGTELNEPRPGSEGREVSPSTVAGDVVGAGDATVPGDGAVRVSPTVPRAFGLPVLREKIRQKGCAWKV